MRQPPAAGTLTLPGLEDVGLSPIRRQYMELKRRQPDALLLFRLGDFYETFEDDAHVAARVLDITLTSREMGRGERLPMAGIPVHAADAYIGRLIGAGLHVAIAEQIGVVPRNGIVPREIARVLTPGMLLESHLLTSSRSNFLLALVRDREGVGLAYVDVSTSELQVTSFSGSPETLSGELVRIGPAEILIETTDALEDVAPPGSTLTRRGPELFAPLAATRVVARHFGGAPESTGLMDHPLAVRALGGLLAYVHEARPTATRTLQHPRLYAVGGSMVLDRATRRNLDLLESAAREGGLSLLRVLDRTSTPMGARLLRNVVGQPLLDAERINQRLDAVECLVRDARLRARLVEALHGLPDLERLAVRAGQQLLAPRECLALAAGLERIPRVQRALAAGTDLPNVLEDGRPDAAPEIAADIHAIVRDGATIFEEGVIKPGVSAELDQFRALGGDARQWIAALEVRERERTGVRGARVGYNKVFGYYLEVSTAQCAQATDYYQRQASGADTVGGHLDRLGWIRKQTLANAERFVTPELKEMEARVARAHDDALQLERELYNALLERLAERCAQLALTARALALLDVFACLAESASAHGYQRPVVDESDALEIVEGRHPVVEHSLPPGQFVANDTQLGSEARVMLLTGPNMAGKSTYLRQVALIVLMAQIGSFVPARSAHVGIVDRIFTRIGAHDDIAAGRSTFMVEMTEAATIVRSATARSLVVLDEVGRGTSTFDGMAIAQAIVEELHDPERPGGAPKTIFATHYHELTALADSLKQLRTYRVDVLERGEDVVFLHAVVEGGADRSYGVHVARLAGVPERVTARAAALLSRLESSSPSLSFSEREGAGGG
ncbi:MAG: DNA mismatch repair protein MutS [Chloroflexi bacterium]|nr:DNA mismatch repair protein MutS [Chloroflexota bacterium]